jgi:hypothetical protein
MPDIHGSEIILTEAEDTTQRVESYLESSGINRRFRTSGRLVGSVAEAVQHLANHRLGAGGRFGRFRITDFPSLVVIWEQVAPSAAVAYTLRAGMLEVVHVFLGGRNFFDDEVALDFVVHIIASPTTAQWADDRRRHLGTVQYSTIVFRTPVSPEGIIGLIALTPIFCERCGIP